MYSLSQVTGLQKCGYMLFFKTSQYIGHFGKLSQKQGSNPINILTNIIQEHLKSKKPAKSKEKHQEVVSQGVNPVQT